jgi:hypothetical protein
MLDEKSEIFYSEKKYVEENASNGVKMKYHYSSADETKQVAEDEYEVHASMKLDITQSDGSTKEVKLQKVYTVHDENSQIFKIRNIK